MVVMFLSLSVIKSKDIVKLTLIIDENPHLVVITFEFKDIISYIETNIRVNGVHVI